MFFASFNMMIPELPGFLDQLGGGAYKGFIIRFIYANCRHLPTL